MSSAARSHGSRTGPGDQQQPPGEPPRPITSQIAEEEETPEQQERAAEPEKKSQLEAEEATAINGSHSDTEEITATADEVQKTEEEPQKGCMTVECVQGVSMYILYDVRELSSTCLSWSEELSQTRRCASKMP